MALLQRKKVLMFNQLLIANLLSLVLSGAAMAQHGGTEQEQRACAASVKRYCRSVLDQGDLAVLARLQQNRKKLSSPCQKVLTDHGQ
jgi:hypothetical protein